MRGLVDSLGRLPAAVLCVAALGVAFGYCAHDNVDPAPKTAYHRLLAAGDGHMHYLITRSLVFDRDIDFDNDLAAFGDPWNQPRTVTGRKNVEQQLGPSLVWAPFLVLAHGAALVANACGADIPTHGYTLFHQRIVFASSVLFACLAMLLGVALARRLGVGRWAATWAGAAVLLGTSLTYYATYMPSYAHAMDAAACAIFLARWAMTIGELRWRRYVELGLWLGLAAMVRIQDFGFGIVVAVELVALAWRGRDVRILARGAVVLAVAVACHLPQLYVWKQFYGTYLTTPQGPGQMHYDRPLVLEMMFSARNGWLSSHPISYLALIGLVLGAWRGPRIGPEVRLVCVGLLAALAVQIYINSVVYDWWSSSSFGQRKFCSSTLSTVVGLAVLLALANGVVRRRAPKLPRWARHAFAVIGLGYLVAWNVSWIHRLGHTTNADHLRAPTCCETASAGVTWLARPIYAAIGNPFELPASALYAARNGVSLQRWDQSVGTYALVPGVLGWLDGSYRRETATWNWTGAGDAPWLLSGFGPPQKVGGRGYRWTTADRAEAILPLLVQEPHRVKLWVAANTAAAETVEVTVWCNGRVATRATVGAAWTQITFDTDGTVGDNAIAFATPVRTPRGGPAAPSEAPAIGLAIGQATVGLVP